MEVLTEDALEQEIARSPASFMGFLESQRELLHAQIDQLQNVVVTQCKLTGANPLSQEMAAGALSINIGKRPRDLLNPKAVKYMQAVFAIRDAISKKESREISARFGVKVAQVRDFFASQRTRVRKFVRVSREKAVRSEASKVAGSDVPTSSESSAAIDPVPLSAVGPSTAEEAPSCSSQNDALPDIDELDKHFVNNIFNLMGKEETFTGQAKLMKWILQIQTAAVLSWFLTKGGLMIIATWLSQAASEEQTSVLYVILEVLSHLPIHEAVPAHVSAILQSVNGLRFYRTSDVSNRAKAMLAKWCKMFARAQSLKKPNGMKPSDAALTERVWRQSLSEIMSDEAWPSNTNSGDGTLACYEGSENTRKLESSQPLKLLTAAADDTNRKHTFGLSPSQTKERRKVQFVEQPGQKMPVRGAQASKAAPNRPITVDDIKKAKLRASYMQSKYGKKPSPPITNSETKNETEMKPSTSYMDSLPLVPKAEVDPKVEEQKIAVISPAKIPDKPDSPAKIPDKPDSPAKVPDKPDSPVKPKLDLRKPRLEECKRSKIPWRAPQEVRMDEQWRVGTGEDSKEVEVQRNRNRREKETLYRTLQEIPPNPKEPWDREMDYDDSLTPLIPIEQLPDADAMQTSEEHMTRTLTSDATLASSSSSLSQNASSVAAEPDLELLAVLLKNPELVFALTSGQSGNLSNEDTVRLLDMVKSGGTSGIAGNGGRREEKVEVSLPSPTPSSDPVTNPFSKQGQMSNRVTTQMPTASYPGGVLQQQLTSLQQLLQMQQLQTQTASVPSVPELQTPSVASGMQHRSSAASPTLPDPSSGPVPAAMNFPDRLYGARMQPHHHYAEPTVQKHTYQGSSPVSGSNSWRDGAGFQQATYPHLNHQTANFNASYDGGHLRHGSNSHVGAAAGRYTNYTQEGRNNFPEPMSSPGQASYRPERPVQRHSPSYWDPSRYNSEKWQQQQQRDRRY